MITYWARRLEGTECAMNFEWTKMIILVIIFKAWKWFTKIIAFGFVKMFSRYETLLFVKGNILLLILPGNKI